MNCEFEWACHANPTTGHPTKKSLIFLRIPAFTFTFSITAWLSSRRLPAGLNQSRIPLVPGLLKFRKDFRFTGRLVALFPDVILQIEQLWLINPIRLDQLPVSMTNCCLLAESPVKRLMRCIGFCALDKWQQIDAVKIFIGGNR